MRRQPESTFGNRFATSGCKWPRTAFVVLLLASAIWGQGPIWAVAALPGSPLRAADHQVGDVILEVFYLPDSDLSTKALQLAAEMERKQPGLRVVTYDVLKDHGALTRLWKLAKRQGVEKPTAPAFYAYGQMKFGFLDPESTRREIQQLYTIHAFTREGCPHCRDAKAFLQQLQRRRPGIRVEIHDVMSEAGARDRLMQLSQQHHMPATGLPCFYACGRFMVGFQSAETTGRQLEGLFRNAEPEKRAAPIGEHSRPGALRLVAGALKATSGGRWLLAASGFCLAGLQAFPAPDSSPSAATTTSERIPSEPILSAPVTGEAVPTESAVEVPPLPPELEADPVPLPDNEITAPPSEGDTSEQQIVLPLFGPLRVRDWGLPGFTFLVGLVDGFNPCAMWVLIFLLSVLVNIKDRKKIIVIAGTFVAISGLAYFAFMAAWLNVFAMIGWARPTQIALGLLATVIGLINVKDFVAFGRGVSLSIPDSAKPGIYARVRQIVTAKYLTAALVSAAALAVLVNVIELLCTAGLPALYTQILTLQGLPAWENYLYLGLYNVAYMFDDTVMLVLTVVTLSHRRLQQSEGRWLKLVSGLVILALGLTMIFRPEWLQ
ncbi:MAG TPA: glutaredoxin domain-containing protein [Pirellulales bacterium]|nr:glutaredoxin domain-containing protein [Pirellulales bacterium]